MPNKIEKKHLYEGIRKLNSYFYVCYSNANAIFRNSYGTIIVNKMSSLLTIISKIYFADFGINDLYCVEICSLYAHLESFYHEWILNF